MPKRRSRLYIARGIGMAFRARWRRVTDRTDATTPVVNHDQKVARRARYGNFHARSRIGRQSPDFLQICQIPSTLVLTQCMTWIFRRSLVNGKPSVFKQRRPRGEQVRGVNRSRLSCIQARGGERSLKAPFNAEHEMAHQSFQTCIDACNACADACDHCATACLAEPDVKMMAECIRLDMDCAAICRLAAGYIARDSKFAIELCELCADVCEACGTECAKHQAQHCQDCAQACRRCAEECRRMASKAGADQTRRSGMAKA